MLDFRSAESLQKAVLSGNTTRNAVAKASLKQADARKELNALIHKEDHFSEEEHPGILTGVPIAIKDNLLHKGRPCSCASKILEGYIASSTAFAVEQLEKAGAIIIGRSNMDEFAMGSTTESSVYGPTLNPWNPKRVPGGSSGGAAALVAAGIVPIAIGSSTGGSVRQPASYCGVVGIKPTYGRVSRRGLVAYASSLDVVAPIASNINGAARALQAMSGFDPLDESSLQQPGENFLEAPKSGVAGLRVGLLEEGLNDGNQTGINTSLNNTAHILKEAGATCTMVSLPDLSKALAAYYILAPSEASSNLSRFDGIRYGPRAETEDLYSTYTKSRSQGFGEEVKRRILLGTFCLSSGYYDAFYSRAKAFQAQLQNTMTDLFNHVDLILMPTTPGIAPLLGSHDKDPLNMYLSDIYTVTANLTGNPAISVPCGISEEMPIGAQLIAPHWKESTLLAAGAVIEEAVGTMRPSPKSSDDHP